MSGPPTFDNVIEFKRIEPDDELYEKHWAALARLDPEWAARQIGGLLRRALEAEAELAARNGSKVKP